MWFVFVNLPFDGACNPAVIFGLVLLIATLICRMRCISKCLGLPILQMLVLWNPWPIIEVWPVKVLEIVHLNWLHWFFLILVKVVFFILIDSMILVSPFIELESVCLQSVFHIIQELIKIYLWAIFNHVFSLFNGCSSLCKGNLNFKNIENH